MQDDAKPSSTLPVAPRLSAGVHYYTADSPASGTNGFAIAAFVLGLVGFVVLSVIFGIVALNKLRDRPQRGKGLAIAGLCLSGVWVVIFAAVLAARLPFEAISFDPIVAGPQPRQHPTAWSGERVRLTRHPKTRPAERLRPTPHPKTRPAKQVRLTRHPKTRPAERV